MPKPFMTVIGGPNGSGKTALADHLRTRIDFGEYVNADDIARQLTGDYDKRVREAQSIAAERRAELIDQRKSFTFETVMSHPSKIETMHEARNRGFDVFLIFVGTSNVEINISRVRLRVSKGGHDVPQDRIVGRWFRSMALLQLGIRASDQSYIFDSSGFDTSSSIPRLILRYDGSTGPTVVADHVPDWVDQYAIRALRS